MAHLEKQAPTKMLKAVPLFSNCSDRELKALSRVLREVDFKAGKTICSEGETGLGLHIIADGEAKVIIRGRTRARVGPGDFFGEVALLDGGPRTASVVAETDVKALALPVWQFRETLREHPSITFKMLEVVAERLRAANAADAG